MCKNSVTHFLSLLFGGNTWYHYSLSIFVLQQGESLSHTENENYDLKINCININKLYSTMTIFLFSISFYKEMIKYQKVKD